jgi:hypothetical protein
MGTRLAAARRPHDPETEMHASPRSTPFTLRLALATALACSSLLVGCDRAREPATAAPAASAASGATQ